MNIGIEPALTPIKEYLIEKGYTVTELNHDIQKDDMDYTQFDAIVISGMSDDFLGMEDIKSDALIIDASGLTPEEVEEELNM